MDFPRLRFINKHLPEAEFRVQQAYARTTIAGRGLGRIGGNHDGMKRNPIDQGTEELEAAQQALQRLHEERQALLDALPLDKLPEPFRRLVELRYAKGWSIRRIALETCYSERHIVRLLKRAEETISKGGGS